MFLGSFRSEHIDGFALSLSLYVYVLERTLNCFGYCLPKMVGSEFWGCHEFGHAKPEQYIIQFQLRRQRCGYSNS